MNKSRWLHESDNGTLVIQYTSFISVWACQVPVSGLLSPLCRTIKDEEDVLLNRIRWDNSSCNTDNRLIIFTVIKHLCDDFCLRASWVAQLSVTFYTVWNWITSPFYFRVCLKSAALCWSFSWRIRWKTESRGGFKFNYIHMSAASKQSGLYFDLTDLFIDLFIYFSERSPEINLVISMCFNPAECCDRCRERERKKSFL